MLIIRIINPQSLAYGRTFEATRTLGGYVTLNAGIWTGAAFAESEAEEQ
jgi:hypothetical protein